MNIFLSDVAPEECFRANNGKVIKNLYVLVDSLKEMDDNTFEHHVNNDRNDFANWIKYVIKDKELASNIQRLNNKNAIIKKIEKKIIDIEDKEHFKFHGFGEKEQEPIKQKVGLKKLAKVMQQVLNKEKAIEERERKIQEIESKIEKKIENKISYNETSFFSQEFVQGLFVGLLLGLIVLIVYIQFF